MVDKEEITAMTNLTLSSKKEIISTKKQILKDDIKHYKSTNLQLFTNFYNFSLSKDLKVFLFSATLLNFKEINEKDSLIRIRPILNSERVKSFLSSNFKQFIISRNNIYVLANGKIIEEIYLDVFLTDKGTWEIIDTEELKLSIPDEKVFKLRIAKKQVFQDYNYGGNQENLNYIHFMNIFLKKLLKQCNYVQSDPLMKSVYYNKNSKYRIQTDSQAYFTSGCKVTLNYYDGGTMLLKSVQKFRLLREKTYLELLMEINRNDTFCRIVEGKKGLAYYNFRTWRIDMVDFSKSPATETIVKNSGERIPMLKYYADTYNVKIKYPNQPLLVHFDKRRTPEGGEKIVGTYYLVPELLFIVGKLEERENYAKFTLISPEEKYRNTAVVVSDLKKAKDEVLGAPIISNIDMVAYELQPPEIIFNKKNSRKVNHKGVFEIDDTCEPIDEAEEYKVKKNFWVLLIIDSQFEDCRTIYTNLSSTQYFNDYFENPSRISLKQSNMYDENTYQSYLSQQLETKIKELKNDPKNDKFRNFKLALVIIPQKFKDRQYYGIKNVMNQFQIPSQVILQEKFLDKLRRGNIKPICTKIFFSMLNKIGVSIFHPNIIDRKVQKKVMVCGYSVGKCFGKKMVTCLNATLSYTLTTNYFFTAYEDENTTGSTTIPSLIIKALKYFKEIEENGEVYPETVVIYRESVTPNQRAQIIEFELEEIQNMIRDVLKISVKIVFIFANKMTDVRLFLPRDNGLDNVPVGTLVESTITSNKFWEFIINSTAPRQGTARPTNYIVGYDDSDLSATFIYRLTYYLTFCYYNNNCSVRLPAHLMNTTRHVNFISKYLNEKSNMPSRSNYAL